MIPSKYADYQTHESFGMVQFSRNTGTNHKLYGSSITHSNTITLSVSGGSVKRDLYREWYMPEKQIVEIELSETQFAELITSMNMGSGVPCTILRHEGKRMENPPFENQRMLFENEFKEKVKEVGIDLEALSSELEKLVEKKASKTEFKALISKISKVSQEVNSNLPFVQKSFNEAMDKTVSEAKGEVEAFVLNKVTSLGIKSLQGQFKTPLIENTGNSDE